MNEKTPLEICAQYEQHLQDKIAKLQSELAAANATLAKIRALCDAPFGHERWLPIAVLRILDGGLAG